MNKIYLTLMLFLPFAGFTQIATDLLLNADFEITYKETVKVKVGAAVADKKKQELHSGTEVGNVKIDPKVYAQMEEQTGTSFHIEIKKYGLGNWKEITLRNNKNNQIVKGLFDAGTRKFIFATAKGKKQNEKCGSLAMGAITGTLSVDMKKIENGEFGVGFLAGCNPILINASITFYYTGVQTASVSTNTSVTDETIWSASEDTLTVKSWLENSRWQPVSWAHKGTIIKAKPNDFAGFGANNSYEAVLLNLYDRGTWKYIGKYNALELKLGKSQTTYFITEITDSTLKCYSFNDEFTLQKSVKNNPVISSSAETTTISKTWQIAYHKKGALKPTYKPNDFIRFFNDGTYEQVLFNIYTIGKWSWVEDGKKIKVNCGGESQWDVAKINEDELNLSRTNEVLNLKKKN